MYESKLEFELIPQRDLGAVLDLIDTYNKQTLDSPSEILYMLTEQSCTKAGWTEGAVAALEKGVKDFPNSAVNTVKLVFKTT